MYVHAQTTGKWGHCTKTKEGSWCAPQHIGQRGHAVGPVCTWALLGQKTSSKLQAEAFWHKCLIWSLGVLGVPLEPFVDCFWATVGSYRDLL